MAISLKNKLKGKKTTRKIPATWLFFALSGLLGVFTVFLIIALAGYSPSDPTFATDRIQRIDHILGLPGALISSLLYEMAGMASWIWVLTLPLASVILIKEKSLKSLVFWAGGAIWLLVASSALMGATGMDLPFSGGEIPLGGYAGSTMAQSLDSLAGKLTCWGVPILLLVAGIVLLGFSGWSFLGPFLEPQTKDLRKAKSKNQNKESEIKPPEEKNQTRPFFTGSPVSEEENPFSNEACCHSGPKITDHAKLAVEESLPKEESTPKISEPLSNQLEQKQDPNSIGPRIRPRSPHADIPEAKEIVEKKKGPYTLPSLELLKENKDPKPTDHAEILRRNSLLLEEKLRDFGVKGQVVEVAPGPVVTMYEFKPAPGVKISKVANLSDDLAMNLKARSIRIVAPIPGKAVIGIEIPSEQREMVYLRELLSSKAFAKGKTPLTLALGKDILGAPVTNELNKMPHLLIAGATGAGKSVFINTMVLSILYRATPQEVRMLMVDPKRIELSTYNDIPHLLHPIITSPQDATSGLRWAVAEMERRYELLARLGVRNINSFNDKVTKEGFGGLQARTPTEEDLEQDVPLPYIVVIIDELADLMMVASKEVEGLITRLAQMARAAGIHLVLATQRPSVDVITGIIKANFPSRISFQVTSRVDSRTILDQQGAEHLLGKGDMLFVPPGTSGLTRLHGAFVSDSEIEAVAGFVRSQGMPDYDESIVQTPPESAGAQGGDDDTDERYYDAVAVVRETGQASISFVQRRLRVGYNRAARMIEQMEREGIVGPSDGSRPREVLLRD